MAAAKKISVVTTLYRSADFVAEFYQRMTKTVHEITPDYELIFVDDGSPDASGDRVKELILVDNHVKLVEFSRNFGHHQAMMAGLRESAGDLVFLIDIDLEDAPEWLTKFYQHMGETGADVVYGVQSERAGSWWRKFSGNWFYTFFNSLSETKIPENLCTVRLMTRDYVQALGSLQDKNLFMAGNWAWTGFRQVPLIVAKEYMRSQSTYTLSRKIKLLQDAITSFTAYPLQLIFAVGFLIALVSAIAGTAMLIQKLIYPDYILLGYASIIVSLWFLGGLIILFVGTVGLYVSKVFTEVKGRPPYVIRRIYGQTKGDEGEL